MKKFFTWLGAIIFVAFCIGYYCLLAQGVLYVIDILFKCVLTGPVLIGIAFLIYVSQRKGKII